MKVKLSWEEVQKVIGDMEHYKYPDYLEGEKVGGGFSTGGVELILTHTHAGVDSIRRKILSFKPSNKNFHIETIDGFILRYVLNYPHTSNWKGTLDDIDWPKVRACGVSLFKKEFIKQVIKKSFSGLYVDEYQDCCEEQHLIALEIASVLPIRILGDLAKPTESQVRTQLPASLKGAMGLLNRLNQKT